SFSKLNSRDDLSLSRWARHCRVINESEARGCLAVRIVVIHPGLHSLWIGRCRVVEERPVEHVRELDARGERHFFADPEQTANGYVLDRPALLAVIVVIGGGAELTGGRVRPGLRIQSERRI